MPSAGSTIEWRFPVLIWLVGVDVVPSEQYSHRSLVPIARSPLEWRLAVLGWLVKADVVLSEQ